MERFSSSFKGYNINEVNKFVDEMTNEYSSIINKLKAKDVEIERLKNENADLQRKLNNNNLGSIYSSGTEITGLARNEAKNIIEDAKKNASRIVNDALLEAEKIEFKTENMKRNMTVFKRRMRTIVKSQLETIEDIEELKLDE